MSKRALVIFGIFAALCLVVLPLWALGKEGSETSSPADVASTYKEGQELFQTNCGACHTLVAAGTDGVVGPDLDDRFGQGAASEDTFAATRDIVLNAIENGVGGRMPAGILTGEQAKETAEFVGANVEYVGP
jgi:mono/diheme cytochrome c family protein